MMKRIWAHIRCFFWMFSWSSWEWWKMCFWHGPRYQIFRNKRYPKGFRNLNGDLIEGKRVFIHFRWGFAILGFEFGDRGHARESKRRRYGLAP